MMDQEAEFRVSGGQQLLFAPSYCNINVMCHKHCYATMKRDAGATLVYQLATVMVVITEGAAQRSSSGLPGSSIPDWTLCQ